MTSRFSVSSLCAALLGSVLVFPVAVKADELDGIFEVPDRPSLNFYGAPGLMDMPSGEALHDGQVAIGVSSFGGNNRTTLTFQALPRVQASFRYSGIKEANLAGFDTYRDRSFDVRFLLNRESRYLPALTLGLQDFAGTGIYSGEFLAATKNFKGPRGAGTVKATVGLGWGRLGSSGSIGSPFAEDRPSFRPGDTGGEFSTDQWFRGDAAPFAGVEWQINDKWGVKAEYSSDAYNLEQRQGVLEPKSRFNFGAEYQVSESTRLGAYYLYGSEFGLNLQIQINPRRPVAPLRIPAPRPFFVRPSRREDPQAYDTAWATSEDDPSVLVRDAIIPLLEEEDLTLVAVHTTATTTEVRYRGQSHGATSVSIGRVARIMAKLLPDSVETFRIVPVVNNLPQSAVVFRRSDLEALEFSPNATDELLAVTGFSDVAYSLPGSAQNEALFPEFGWSVAPFFERLLFDADNPVRVDAGISVEASYQPAPGWKIAGELRHRLYGDIDKSLRENTSRLTPVRTDGVRYSAGGDTWIPRLYVSRQWKPAPDTYARVSAGYLERMFGGVSAEVMWKPVNSRLALGLEANYVKQRAFDEILGFQEYSVATGHASAYYEFNNGFTGKVDVGRYLAGDVGATFTLEREFANGWRLGGFFSVTDVSTEDFGAGSFDKGITVTVPAQWFLGRPDKRREVNVIRPFQRDGAARLSVPGRLYDQVRDGHRQGLVGNWSGVWE